MSSESATNGGTRMISARPVRVLLIDAGTGACERIGELLLRTPSAQFNVERVDSVSAGVSRLQQDGFDAVLLGRAATEGAERAALQELRRRAPQTPVVVLSQQEDEAAAVKSVHQGAQDFLVTLNLGGAALERAILCAMERKQSEAALARAEEKYHGIFDNLVEGVFQTSPNGRYLSANLALARIYGYESPEELIGNVTDIGRRLYVQPSRRDEFIRLMEKNDVVTGFESQIYRKDGSVIWISENVRAIRDARQNLLCYEGTVEDITARKLAEERLRDSEALYHSLVETLPQNIFRKDLNERFTFVNQRFCDTMGRTANEIIGKTDYDFFPPELAAKYQRDDRGVIESGTVFETIEEHQPPGGDTLYVQVIKTPLYDAAGKIIGLQGLFWDITEKKRAEERERKANAELARSREELRVKNEQMEDDLKMAREIQQAFLPQQYPVFPHTAAPGDSALQFTHRYHPTGAVGGDFFNVLALSDTEAGVFICDVMGHGVRSALVTAMVRALVEELKPLALDPGRMLTQLNHDLQTILRQTGSPTFTTAFYLVADLAQGHIRFASAGHPRPLLVRRESGAVTGLGEAQIKSGPALGLFERSVYQTAECGMNPGDLVMLFTDGLYEVEGPEHALFSPEMLRAAVSRHAQGTTAELFDSLLNEIQDFSVAREFDDDVCLLGMDVKTPLKS